MRVLRVGKPDEWGAVGLLLALEGQNFGEFPFHALGCIRARRRARVSKPRPLCSSRPTTTLLLPRPSM
jgi:hypothetical protein